MKVGIVKQPELLIVYGKKLSLELMVGRLAKNGYRVYGADSAEMAEILLLQGVQPDLAILDIALLQNSGFRLVERLRKFDQVPFLFLGKGDGTGEAILKTIDLGTVDYLPNFLELYDLDAAIIACLARARELKIHKCIERKLQIALDSEREISVAIGIAMVLYRLPQESAYTCLWSMAHCRQSKLSKLAREIIKVCQVPTFGDEYRNTGSLG